MPQKKSKNVKASLLKKSIIIGSFFLAFFVFSFFVRTEKANAGTCFVDYTVWEKINNFPFTYDYYKNVTQQQCDNYCANNSRTCSYKNSDISTVAGIAAPSAKDNPDVKMDYHCPFLSTPVVCLLSPVLTFVRFLFSASATFFSWVIKIDNVELVLSGLGIIYSMWTVVRDLLNVVFILVLLFSAFCTIFQISKYNYKKVLLTLVIMALLVNFSYPITRVIIDASNVMMYSLINKYITNNNNAMIFTADVARNSGLGDLFAISTYKSAGMLLTSVVFLFIFTVTLFAFAILLFVRLIALAIIIIFSPIGFVGNVMPGFEKYASQWWDNLFKYAFFGPIMILGLDIAVRMMAALKNLGDLSSVAKDAGLDPNIIGRIAFMVIPIVILWMVMGLAQSMSIAGASTVMSQAQKFMKWSARNLTGYRLAKFGIKRGAKTLDRDVLAKYGLSVKTFKDAWKARQDELDKRKYGKATGDWRDRINKFFGQETRFGDAAVQNHIAEKQKEYENVSTDFKYLYSQYKKAREANKAEDMTALLRILTSTNEGNSFMINEIREEARAQGKTEEEIDQMEAFNPFATTDRYIDQLIGAGMDEHMAVKQVNDMGLVSIGKGMTQLHGAGKMDISTGKYTRYKTNTDTAEGLADRSARVQAVQGKINETKAQTWADTFHWTSLFNQKADGSVGSLHDMGISQLTNLTGAQIQQMTRIRGDGAQKTHQGIKQIRKLKDKLLNDAVAETDPDKQNDIMAQAERIERFIGHIEDMNKGKRI